MSIRATNPGSTLRPVTPERNPAWVMSTAVAAIALIPSSSTKWCEALTDRDAGLGGAALTAPP